MTISNNVIAYNVEVRRRRVNILIILIDCFYCEDIVSPVLGLGGKRRQGMRLYTLRIIGLSIKERLSPIICTIYPQHLPKELLLRREDAGELMWGNLPFPQITKDIDRDTLINGGQRQQGTQASVPS